MKSALLLLGVVLGTAIRCATLAEAAESAAPTPADWTGVYAGVYSGGMQVDTQWTIPAPDPIKSTETAKMVGGDIGLNFQTGLLLIGIEGDFGLTDYKVSGITACGGACNTNIDSLGTLRGRVGLIVGDSGSLLIYGTGGYAFGRTENYYAGFDNKALIDGWSLGGGFEYLLSDNLSLRADYLHIELGSSLSCDVPFCIGKNTNDFIRTDVFRGGINVRF